MNYQMAFYGVCICFFIVAAIAIYLLLITKSLAKSIRSLQDEAIEQRRDFINFLEGLESANKLANAIIIRDQKQNLNESLQQAYERGLVQDAQRVKLWSS